MRKKKVSYSILFIGLFLFAGVSNAVGRAPAVDPMVSIVPDKEMNRPATPVDFYNLEAGRAKIQGQASVSSFQYNLGLVIPLLALPFLTLFFLRLPETPQKSEEHVPENIVALDFKRKAQAPATTDDHHQHDDDEFKKAS